VVSVALAVVDCERRDSWWFEQDVNAWTSLAYAAAAAVLVVAVVRGRLPRVLLVLAVATGLEGIGSLLFHGATSDTGHLVHDVGVVAILGFVAGWHAGRLAAAADTGAGAGAAAATAIAVVAWPVASGATTVVAGVSVAVVVASEFLARRRGMPPVVTRPLLVLTAVAAVVWVAGSSGSAVCAEDSWIQWHGLWHVLSAVLIVAWAARAAAAAPAAPTTPPGRVGR
jgi:hypothetical protein